MSKEKSSSGYSPVTTKPGYPLGKSLGNASESDLKTGYKKGG